jgi:hypothetical protein
MRIDGRLANRIVLSDDLWRDMRVILPVTRAARPFRRVDLLVRRIADDNQPGAPPRDSNDVRVRVRTIRVE